MVSVSVPRSANPVALSSIQVRIKPPAEPSGPLQVMMAERSKYRLAQNLGTHACLSLLDHGQLPGTVSLVAAVVDAYDARAARGETGHVGGRVGRARRLLDVAVEAAVNGQVVDDADGAQPVRELVVEVGADLYVLLDEGMATPPTMLYIMTERPVVGSPTAGP